MKFHHRKIVSILAAACAAFVFAAVADAATFTVGTYEELYNQLKAINPDGDQYDDTKDENILIELTADLDVNGMPDLGALTDEDTGSTLTISRPNVTIDGKDHTITSRGYPSFHVEGNRDAAGGPLEGIVIQNVTVDGAGYQLKMGGGMFFENKAEIALKNAVVKNGSAKMGGGGGVYAGPHGSAFGPTLTIEDCVFEGNKTEAGAGGAILGFYANLTISNSTFDGNNAPLGGAIALYGNGARLKVTGSSSFTDNVATHSGGAVHVFYASGRAASRGTPVISTTDVDADISATFSGNEAAVAGTEDYIFGVAYDPTYTGSDVASTPPSKLKVNGDAVPATLFADADRTKHFTGSIIPISTYRQLQEALGYAKYVNGEFETDEEGHGIVTEGTVEDGDIVYLTGDLVSDPTNPNAAVVDDITGATVYVTKNVNIFGNGHEIDGKGFPVFNVEGVTDSEPEVAVSLSNLKVKEGGYQLKLGGAIFVEGNALLNVYNSTFTGCTADSSGGGTVGGGGGAIYLEPHGKGTPKLYAANNTFTGNKAAKGTGGAISAYMGNITLVNNQFIGNEAASGGAVGAKGVGKLDIQAGNVFTGNKATYAGGAVDIHHGRSFYKRTISDDSRIETTFTGVSTFENNTAQWGDAVAFSRYYDSYYKGNKGEAPTIAFGPATGASMDITIVSDLTFYDIYRTEDEPIIDDGDDDDDGDGDGDGDDGVKKSGGSSGCDVGIRAFAGLGFVGLAKTAKTLIKR
ncbi:MAG: hypothetical protein LBQ42_09990 [Synergistaceae bacterium]|nr:hypothetical protein [Synergistaceae bacterium]